VNRLGLLSKPVRDNNGRYLVQNHDATSIIVYDSTGSFITTVGRAGDGPGEFRGIREVHVAGDLIYAFDIARYHVYTTDLRLVRSVATPRGPLGSAVALANGQVVLHSSQITSQGRASTYYHIGADGAIIQEFPGSIVDVSCMRCAVRTLSYSPIADIFWSIPSNDYRFQRWNVAGGQSTTYVMGSSIWFRAWSSAGLLEPGRTRSSIDVAYDDGAGLLWVGGTIEAGVPRPERSDSAPRGLVLRRLDDPEVLTEAEKKLTSVVDVVD
jgi:hypothetical protein